MQIELLNWINLRIRLILLTPQMWGQSLESIELQLLTCFELRHFAFGKEFTPQDYYKIVANKYKKSGLICSILEYDYSRINEFIFIMKIMNDEINRLAQIKVV